VTGRATPPRYRHRRRRWILRGGQWCAVEAVRKSAKAAAKLARDTGAAWTPEGGAWLVIRPVGGGL
jgi:hypothetical protein